MAIYILSGARTPSGSFMGELSTVPAPKLGGVAIAGALARADGAKNSATWETLVDEVYMGNALQAGVGQAPARQAALAAGLPNSVPCTTINKVCGSGLKAIICGAQSILAGDNKLVIAGGMENMSLSPHLLANSRVGHKFGNSEMKDAMLWDGLWDVYSQRPMGSCAEECAAKYDISRETQDDYAIESFKRAQNAANKGYFAAEIVPVTLSGKRGASQVISKDEGPFKANFAKIPQLPPAFAKDGSITAANASTINDGAAAVFLAGEDYKEQAKFKILAYASHAHGPTWFTTAPIMAIQKVLEKAQLKIEDIDLFEVNEAFSLVSMIAMKELKLDYNKVNIYGGAVSLGHPIGASGTRIIVTLMHAMERESARYGLAAICIGGGEALSMIIERI